MTAASDMRPSVSLWRASLVLNACLLLYAVWYVQQPAAVALAPEPAAQAALVTVTARRAAP